ncbi:hypothetical protein HZS_2935 [Henneguya salminicola]|nr:hypothetical protein HZS_2935 [Henneguya salminicola]
MRLIARKSNKNKYYSIIIGIKSTSSTTSFYRVSDLICNSQLIPNENKVIIDPQSKILYCESCFNAR